MEIILKNLCKSFGEIKLFNKLNLSIKKNEMLAITGRSGSGKTTLLNIIGLLENIDSGEVIIGGFKEPLKNKTNLYRHVYGFLFQNYALVANMTVNQNLDIALKYVKNKDKKSIKYTALQKVNLIEKANEKVYRLSGGEQQRIALARLMIKPNEIILADEPTGSLDDTNRDLVINLLKDFNNNGKTIVIVTHDRIVADSCSRVINL